MMLWRTRVIAAGLGFAGLAGLFALVPSQSDRVGLLMRDGALIRAGVVNERLLTKKPDSPILLYRAYLLRSEAGDIDGATLAVERLASASGDRIEAIRVLAGHYFDIGEMGKRLNLLMTADPAELTGEEREMLLGGLRYAARYPDERTVLTRLASAGLLSTTQSGRFGMLLAAVGDGERAIPHLKDFDADTTDRAVYERLTLLHLLLDHNRIDEARQLAGRWHTLWADPMVTTAIKDAFETAGQIWP